MIQKEFVYQLVEKFVADTEYFIVDVRIDAANFIVIEIDSMQGVNIDKCAELSRFIESKLNREEEDYTLEVGSAGLTSPFKVLQQYKKNCGNEVEVLIKAGEKLTGTLKNASEEGFTVTVTEMVKLEGSKRKTAIERDIAFRYNEVNYTKYLIRFK